MENVSGGIGGKVVLITGGTSGIGKAAATALAGEALAKAVSDAWFEATDPAAHGVRRSGTNR